MKTLGNKILILTDFTQVCYDSVSYGLEFCRAYGLTPEIFHVEESCGYDSLELQRIEDIVSLYNRKFNMGAVLKIRKGVLIEVIKEEVSSGGFFMVILGTHGKLGFQTLTGSLVTKIISALTVPILVVHSRKFVPIENTLLPIFENTVISELFSDIAPITRIISNSHLTIICLEEGRSNAEKFVSTYLDGREFNYSLRIMRHSDNFHKQLMKYCLDSNVNMLFSYPIKSDRIQLNMVYEQLIFNIHQIPVICKYA